MVSETLTERKTEAEVTADLVFEWMDKDLKQEQLQIPGTEELTEYEVLINDWISSLVESNPDKIVVKAEDLEEYRYLAAFFGAGFHISQYDEITYRKNKNAGQAIPQTYLNMYAGLPKEVPEYSPRSNRMRDEISERLFTHLVPGVEYNMGTGAYIAKEEDLKKIFQLDYEDLRVCRGMGLDLLYERED